MLGEVLADVVGGSPADALGEVGGEDLHHLLEHGYGDEEDGSGGQPFEGAVLLCFVDEVPDDLRQHKLQAQSDEQQDSQRDDERQLGQHVPSEEATVFPCFDGDFGFSECGRQVHVGRVSIS